MIVNGNDISVSVIIPVYNAEKVLPKTINSVVQQTISNIEIILIDDGSTDDSLDVCRQAAALDSRICVYSQENAGPSAARNTGLQYAHGQFVVFQDSDDIVPSNRIKILLNEQQRENFDLVVGNFLQIISGKSMAQRIKAHCYFSHSDLLADDELIRDRQMFYIWNKLYRRKIISDNRLLFNTSMRMGEDYDFNLRYLCYVNRFSAIDKIVYQYLMDNSSLTREFRKNDYESRKITIHDYIRLYLDSNIPVNRLAVNSWYIQLAMSSIMRLNHPKNTMTMQDKLDYIHCICEDPELVSVINSTELQKNGGMTRLFARILTGKHKLTTLWLSRWVWRIWKLKN